MLQTLKFRGNNPTFQLGKCEGDCDKDADCLGQLVCFQKDAGGTGKVPGCAGKDTSRNDFCVDPADMGAPTGSPPTTPTAPAPTGSPPTAPTAPTRQRTALYNYGASPPTMVLPLGVCEGDCDSDSDCASGLVCLQRGANAGPVPGCSGTDNGKTDYCISSGASPSPPSPPPPGPSPTPPAPTSPGSQNFKLKMYWEEGYFWQEETFERKWCMRCRDGSCDNGDRIYIETCSDDGVERFDFNYVDSDEVQIKVHGTDLCMERSDKSVYIRSCDSGNAQQRWWAAAGGFDEYRFEISQVSASNLCVTQRHHPKSDELIHMEPCTLPRSSDTSYWEKCFDDNC